MILFELAAGPSVRAGEEEIGGRRIAGRLTPYGGEAGDGSFRFDPVGRRFVRRKADATVVVGPALAEPWRQALVRLPMGPLLVGPGSVAEGVRGAYRAAAQGAMCAGRAVYLLDPDSEGIPEPATGAVALCTFAPGSASAFPQLAAARSRGLSCAALFPWIPGWTADPSMLEALLDEAARAGAHSATALVPETDGESRRAIVDARTEVEPEAPEDFFERIHHGDWIDAVAEGLARVREACAARGLALLPPRPVGLGEPAGNAAASSRLEERADSAALDEHRAARLRAAVRWIDESGRDLAAVVREGNFRRVFPFDGDVAAEAESALEGVR